MSKRGCSGRCTPPVVTSARRLSWSGFSGRANGITLWSKFTFTPYTALRSNVEAHYKGISVLDHVVAAFETDLRRLAGSCPGVGGYQVLPVADLRSDKAALHVRVYATRGAARRRALAHGPGPALLLAGGEERDQAEQRVRRP